MLNKKTMKVISIIAMVIMLVVTMSSLVLAASELVPTINTDGETIIKIKNIGGSLYGIFTAIGATVAVVILVWLGIKYIMASPDGKADIKKQAFGYILGAALVFGASQVLALVTKFTGEALQ